MDIFAHAIGFLQQHLLDDLNSRGTGITYPQEIHWVLTVPAIWDDPAKQFMREAAKKVCEYNFSLIRTMHITKCNMTVKRS